MPIIAAGLAELRHGRFSFYPAIVGVRHNEWILRRATWTDILVANAKTSEEICIPRRFVGEVSSIEAPFRIVGLVKELEYREGVVLPHRRSRDRNAARGERFQPARACGPRFIRGRQEWSRSGPSPNSESRFWRVLRGSIAAGFLACMAVIFVVRDAHLGTGFGWTSATRRAAELERTGRLRLGGKEAGTSRRRSLDSRRRFGSRRLPAIMVPAPGRDDYSTGARVQQQRPLCRDAESRRRDHPFGGCRSG